MSPEERARRVRELELELAIRERGQAEQAMTHQPPPPDANAGTARGIASAAVLGPAKGMAGLIDLPFAARDWLQGTIAPDIGKSWSPDLSPKVQGLENLLAGGDTSKQILPAMAGGGTAALLAPGKAAANLAAGAVAAGTTQAGVNAGLSPLAAGALGTAASIPAAAGSFPQHLARGRVQQALEGVSQDQLGAMARTQAEAQRRGLRLFPSQTTPQTSPGLLNLETELAFSKAAGAQGLRQAMFKQPLEADFALRKALNRYLPTSTAPAERTARALRDKAGEVLKQESKDLVSRTEGLYREGLASSKRLSKEQLVEVAEELQAAKKSYRGNKEIERGIADLERRLGAVSDMEVEGKQLAKSASIGNLFRAHQSFVQGLDKLDARGIPTYSDNNAKVLRELANKTIRDRFEQLEGRLMLARELQRSGKEQLPRDQFDQTVRLSRGGKSAQAFIAKAPEMPQGLEEVARMPGGRETVRDALASALGQQREKAFRLTPSGEVAHSSPAEFARNLMGTPGQKEALGRSLQAAGVPSKELMADVELIGAAGRPTAVRGVTVPGTEISPIDLARATVGGSLQAQHGRMNIVRALINRMSDNQVAEILSRPESVAAMQSIAGGRAMEPRALLAAIMAASGQAQEN